MTAWPTYSQWDLPAGIAEPAFRATLAALLDHADTAAARCARLSRTPGDFYATEAHHEQRRADDLRFLLDQYDAHHVDRGELHEG